VEEAAAAAIMTAPPPTTLMPVPSLAKKRKYHQQPQQQQQEQQMKFEQEIAAATAALLGDENTYRLLDESPRISSSSSNVYTTQMTFMIGEKEDKRVVVTELVVNIVTKSDRNKQMKFTQNRWARFLAIVSEVDKEAKELNRKTREVCHRHHIGDGFFVTVTDDFTCTGIRKYFMPYRLSTPGLERQTKAGISLNLDEWRDMMLIAIPAIAQIFPSLACAQAYYEAPLHQTDAGKVACCSCNPFKFVNNWS